MIIHVLVAYDNKTRWRLIEWFSSPDAAAEECARRNQLTLMLANEPWRVTSDDVRTQLNDPGWLIGENYASYPVTSAPARQFENTEHAMNRAAEWLRDRGALKG